MTNEEKYNLITELSVVGGEIEKLQDVLQKLEGIRDFFNLDTDEYIKSSIEFTNQLKKKIKSLKSEKQSLKNKILEDWTGYSIPQLMSIKN